LKLTIARIAKIACGKAQMNPDSFIFRGSSFLSLADFLFHRHQHPGK